MPPLETTALLDITASLQKVSFLPALRGLTACLLLPLSAVFWIALLLRVCADWTCLPRAVLKHQSNFHVECLAGEEMTWETQPAEESWSAQVGHTDTQTNKHMNKYKDPSCQRQRGQVVSPRAPHINANGQPGPRGFWCSVFFCGLFSCQHSEFNCTQFHARSHAANPQMWQRH